MSSDKIFSSDVPKDFNFLLITTTGYKLYNTDNFEEGGTYEYYEFFTSLSSNTYVHGWDNPTNFSQLVEVHQVEVTDDVFYRSDIHDIIGTTFIFALGFIFLINIITSIVRRNGLLGGLL